VPIPPLETERLLVRPLRPEDLDAVHRLYVELAGADLGHPPITEREEVRAWLRWTIDGYDQLARLYLPPYGDRAVILKATGELVGLVGNVPVLAPFGQIPALRGDADDVAARLYTCELGLFWGVARAHRRRGYAVEAASALAEHDFEELELRRIVATTTLDNRASRAVMRGLGMRIVQNPDPDPPWFQIVGILDDTARFAPGARP
jgi:RimJ/RimL family protein N-acetyltransferase